MRKILFLLTLLFITTNLFAEYNKIISLAPSATESLYELGLEKNGCHLKILKRKEKKSWKPNIVGIIVCLYIKNKYFLNPCGVKITAAILGIFMNMLINIIPIINVSGPF